MKKILMFSILFSLFLVSCSNGNRQDYNDDSGTLRAKAEAKFKETVWTREIEKDRLSSNISTVKTIDKNIRLTPLIISASSFAKELKPVFPVLEGFGSLDISNLNSDIKEIASQFCDDFCKGKINDILFASDSIYEAALFMNDLRNNWEKVFKESFPQEKKEELSAEEDKKEKEEFKVFNQYMFGEPFEMNAMYELPVRFSFKKGIVDVDIYFYKNKGKWQIDQLKILSMEAVNGSK